MVTQPFASRPFLPRLEMAARQEARLFVTIAPSNDSGAPVICGRTDRQARHIGEERKLPPSKSRRSVRSHWAAACRRAAPPTAAPRLTTVHVDRRCRRRCSRCRSGRSYAQHGGGHRRTEAAGQARQYAAVNVAAVVYRCRHTAGRMPAVRKHVLPPMTGDRSGCIEYLHFVSGNRA